MLEIEGLGRSFGGLLALADVSLTVPEGAIAALIGPNGAGKTTLFSVVTGFLAPDRGRVRFAGRDITGLPPHAICALGLARTFQIAQPFGRLSVRENIAVGAHLHCASRRRALAEAELVADRVGLADRLGQEARALTLAGRKRLELARVLATRPRCLLLDEVMGGLNPGEVAEFIALIRRLSADGITILLVEHVMQAVMSLGETVHVLGQGRIIAAGPPAAIAADPAVIETYLGHGAAARLAVGQADG